ncbi:hypothetical protein HPB47_018150 [Ixodes persulcatus]|uniref:Uncharacterized protein n=1 Tax=Ixodes persulcatus TaxID=34615 RepID=A0AC60QLI8_IXOPE|nr:hypothetical protein HPB47_018150 [Ixodes persulcatus]
MQIHQATGFAMPFLRHTGIVLWRSLSIEAFRRHYLTTTLEQLLVILCFAQIRVQSRQLPFANHFGIAPVVKYSSRSSAQIAANVGNLRADVVYEPRSEYINRLVSHALGLTHDFNHEELQRLMGLSDFTYWFDHFCTIMFFATSSSAVAIFCMVVLLDAEQDTRTYLENIDITLLVVTCLIFCCQYFLHVICSIPDIRDIIRDVVREEIKKFLPAAPSLPRCQ